jgi:hypothetical protein
MNTLIKKQCSNFPKATYSGKEQSPLRFGLSAEGYSLNTVLEGNDKLPWIVQIKNNRKVWIRHLINEKITHEDPVITEKDIETVKEDIKEDQTECDNSCTISVAVKKTTDYNVFLSYRLKQLKKENKDMENDCDNKTLFNKVMDEWKLLKASPFELKSVIDKIKSEEVIVLHKPKKTTVPKNKKNKNEVIEIASELIETKEDKTVEEVIPVIKTTKKKAIKSEVKTDKVKKEKNKIYIER